jgi:ATP-dependent exoDNAse (exonuclease V) alpha subunit
VTSGTFQVPASQGATVDRAYVLGTAALYREAGYVAMSRARERTEVFVTGAPFETGVETDQDGR